MTNNIDDEWNQFLLQFSNGSNNSDYILNNKIIKKDDV